VASGKVCYLGHSNRAGWQIGDADFVARIGGSTRFISAQNHYSLLDRRAELEVIPAALAYGIGVLPYFPLGSGLLTGKYGKGIAPEGSRLTRSRSHLLTEADFEHLGRFSRFVAARGLSQVTVAVSWLASQPAVASVIADATTPEQVCENARAVGWEPSTEDLAELDTIFPRVPRVALF
jgi:aryl-alcohol dehydrogenase-like predicted oxidoreductase